MKNNLMTYEKPQALLNKYKWPEKYLKQKNQDNNGPIMKMKNFYNIIKKHL